MKAPTPFYISSEDLLAMIEVRRSQEKEKETHAADGGLADCLDRHLGY